MKKVSKQLIDQFYRVTILGSPFDGGGVGQASIRVRDQVFDQISRKIDDRLYWQVREPVDGHVWYRV